MIPIRGSSTILHPHPMAPEPEMGEVTRVLRDTGRHDERLIDRLFPVVYEDLKRVALARLGAPDAEQTLNATALVHEVYARFAKRPQGWANRAHFFAVAAGAMRQIIIDHARTKTRARRGGKRVRVTLDPSRMRVGEQAETLLELNDALERLEGIEPRLARVVEYRFFSGLSEEECAEVLGVTSRTVRRDWVKAKGLLAVLLDAEPGPA